MTLLSLRLRIWRQLSAESPGSFEHYHLPAVSPELSLLEALDRLNDQLTEAGDRPVTFEHD